jgi:RNA methyltransferase, TrmH family
MIPLQKLARLAPRHRMRKIALVLGELERAILDRREGEEASSPYCLGLAGLLGGEAEFPAPVREASARLAGAASSREGLLRAVDALRHALLAASGQAPADWDLIDPSTGLMDREGRRAFPGIRAYLEDLRSPFNIGSIFRTAEAFGAEELLLSPDCADPQHPRARRSAMGALEVLPWKRASLAELAEEVAGELAGEVAGEVAGELAGGLPCFALELGGSPIGSFAFPERGIAILGSEELGISREARELCTLGTVSIPMFGSKGSLNVAVAFGILMHEWTRGLCPEHLV